MECTTKGSECKELAEWPLAHPLVEEQWSEALSTLAGGLDLETTAKQSGALVRKREVKAAADLLRMVLAYAVCDWSLRLMGVWRALLHLGRLSDTAIRKRLQHCQRWLGQIIAALLDVRHLQLAEQPAVHVRLMDASRVSRPGSTDTDWLIHLSLDLAADVWME